MWVVHLFPNNVYLSSLTLLFRRYTVCQKTKKSFHTTIASKARKTHKAMVNDKFILLEKLKNKKTGVD